MQLCNKLHSWNFSSIALQKIVCNDTWDIAFIANSKKKNLRFLNIQLNANLLAHN